MTNHTLSDQLALTETSVIASKKIINWLFPEPRPFTTRFWEGTELPGSGDSCLVLNHPGALRHMLTPPLELSLGEAFIQGDFDIEGDIFSIFPPLDAISQRSFSVSELTEMVDQIRSLPVPPSKNKRARRAARLRGRTHSPERDKAAIQYHYDVGNDFYALWLDRSMQYSCAYFGTGTEDIDTAQTRKLELICRKLRLKPGERLLDIGCGWGGLAIYAAKHFGVRVLGVTLSEQQADFANHQIELAGVSDLAQVKLCDYREIGAALFDKIVSIGMFEHVGERQLPEYFALTYNHLKPGGLFLNHGIARRAPWNPPENIAIECPPTMRPQHTSLWKKFVDKRILGDGLFIQRYVFPDGELLPVSQVNFFAEKIGFEVRDVENLREHYALTLCHWVKRLESHKEEAINLVGESAYRVWRLYMAASGYGFSSGRINVNQTLFAKPQNGRSRLPLTRSDLPH